MKTPTLAIFIFYIGIMTQGRVNSRLISAEEFKCREHKGFSWAPYDASGMCLSSRPTSDIDWFTASEDCTKKGFRLPVIKTASQMQALMIYSGTMGYPWLWVGLSRKNETRDFIWLDGTVLKDSTNTFWQQGEPNDMLKFYSCGFLWSRMKLADWGCAAWRPYVCEIHELTRL